MKSLRFGCTDFVFYEIEDDVTLGTQRILRRHIPFDEYADFLISDLRTGTKSFDEILALLFEKERRSKNWYEFFDFFDVFTETFNEDNEADLRALDLALLTFYQYRSLFDHLHQRSEQDTENENHPDIDCLANEFRSLIIERKVIPEAFDKAQLFARGFFWAKKPLWRLRDFWNPHQKIEEPLPRCLVKVLHNLASTKSPIALALFLRFLHMASFTFRERSFAFASSALLRTWPLEKSLDKGDFEKISSCLLLLASATMEFESRIIWKDGKHVWESSILLLNSQDRRLRGLQRVFREVVLTLSSTEKFAFSGDELSFLKIESLFFPFSRLAFFQKF